MPRSKRLAAVLTLPLNAPPVSGGVEQGRGANLEKQATTLNVQMGWRSRVSVKRYRGSA